VFSISMEPGIKRDLDNRERVSTVGTVRSRGGGGAAVDKDA
jgi:hypothetical protein